MSKERLHCNKCQLDKPASDFSEMARGQARSNDPLAWCQDCVDEFYHARLSPEEAKAYLKEDEDRRLERHRMYGQAERSRADMRWCHALHHTDFIAKLRTLVPSLVAAPGTLYKHISLYRILPNGEPGFLAWMEEGDSPEYDIIHTNRQNLPCWQTRGWRTVLLRLIKAHLITEEQAQRVFGHPSNPNHSGRFYLEALHDARIGA